jgi:hypothetical protein
LRADLTGIIVLRSSSIAGLCLFAILPGAAQDKKKPTPKNDPRVLLAFPLGAPAGKTSKLTLRGANLDSATDVKLLNDKGSVKILAKGKAAVPDKNPDKVGDTQVEIELTLDAKHTGASVSLVVVTPAGESPPHSVLVDTLSPANEKEPNDGFLTAQPIQLPVVITGTLQRPRDVDVVRFDGKKGQKLHVEVLASRHGSPLDSILTLYDAKFQPIGVNDDFAMEHRDAKIETMLPADGVYYLSLVDAHDNGSNFHVYRLIAK